MNKLLKILSIAEFVLILVIIAFALVDNEKLPTAYVVKENQSTEKNDFKTLTKAVCEEKEEYRFCSDKLFIKCNGKEYAVDNFTDVACSSLKLNLSDIEVKGSGVFKKTENKRKV